MIEQLINGQWDFITEIGFFKDELKLKITEEYNLIYFGGTDSFLEWIGNIYSLYYRYDDPFQDQVQKANDFVQIHANHENPNIVVGYSRGCCLALAFNQTSSFQIEHVFTIADPGILFFEHVNVTSIYFEDDLIYQICGKTCGKPVSLGKFGNLIRAHTSYWHHLNDQSNSSILFRLWNRSALR